MQDYLYCEKYRPQTVHECILPDRLKVIFQEYVNAKQIPNLLLAGGPGIGKTTIAKALCKEVGCDYLVINGSDEGRLIDTFRTKIKGYASSMSLAGGRKVVIIDECDYANPESVQPALRNFIEEFSKNCSFIFTCNFKHRIIEPLHSRCAVIDFTLRQEEKTKMASAFFKRVQDILRQESIPYDDKVLAEFVKKFFPDCRRTLNELQRYAQFGKIDLGILSQLGEIALTDIVKSLKAKDFAAIRKWTATHDLDPTALYRKLYDSLYQVLKPESVPQAVLLLADYQYKGSFVADPEIHLTALLTELMISCEFA